MTVPQSDLILIPLSSADSLAQFYIFHKSIYYILEEVSFEALET
ncbi:hypothetical protein [Neochlamydia sp. AcF65]|nr:hypothetical protein [Neochlamydia sp. AcF65]